MQNKFEHPFIIVFTPQKLTSLQVVNVSWRIFPSYLQPFVFLVLQLLPISDNQLCYSFWYASFLSKRLNSLSPSLSWAISQGTNEPCHQHLTPEQGRLIVLYFVRGVCFMTAITRFCIPSLILLDLVMNIRQIYSSVVDIYSCIHI